MKNIKTTLEERKWVFYQPVFAVDNVQPWHGILPWSGHRPFAYDLVRFIGPRIIVELGTHYGTSFYTFCHAVKDGNLNSQCIAIDTWEGDSHSGFYDNDVYETVRDIANRFFPNIHTLKRSRFSEAVTQFDDGSIDLLHIDGYHTLEAVTEDYETWLPKLRSNGVILFHDIAHTGDEFGVYILWDKLSREYPRRAFSHSWGLGVLWPKGTKGYEPLLELPWELVQTLYEQKAIVAWQKDHIVRLEGQKDERIKVVQEKEQQIKNLNITLRDREEELDKILQLKSIRLHRRIDKVLRRLKIID